MISEIVYDNRKLKSNRHIANAFNTYFVNIGKNLAKSIPSMPGESQGYLPKSKQNQNSFFLKPVTVTDIIKVGSSLKSAKACGSDGIARKAVKKCLHSIADPLADI